MIKYHCAMSEVETVQVNTSPFSWFHTKIGTIFLGCAERAANLLFFNTLQSSALNTLSAFAELIKEKEMCWEKLIFAKATSISW